MATQAYSTHVRGTIWALFCISSLLTASLQAISYSGPLIVDDNYVNSYGNIIIGNFAGTITQPAITINTTKMITIINSNVQGPGDLISASNGAANVQVINTNGFGTNPNVRGVAKGRFVRVELAVNVLVKNCIIQGLRMGAYVNRYQGNFTQKQTIKFLNNRVINIDGRVSDGNNGYLLTGGIPTSHAFQFNAIYNVGYTEIAWNEIINQPGSSYVTDVINVFNSSGTSSSHIAIHDNYVQGAYPVNPGVDTSFVGGGIICDGQTNDPRIATAFVDIYNNQVVATANYGIAIASGHDNQVYSNRIVSSGVLPNGKLYASRFAQGMYNWNALNQPSNVFYNNLMRDNNPVGLIRPDPQGKPQRADWWFPGQRNNANNINWQPNTNQSPTLANEAQEYQLWLAKVKNNKQIIGNMCSQ